MDFNTVINNTSFGVIGNLIDTTVSDEKLKYDIDYFNEECTECVKNVKIKTFKYKDEKYKNNDQYGMVAPELLLNLPKAMKGIVKEKHNRTFRMTPPSQPDSTRPFRRNGLRRFRH